MDLDAPGGGGRHWVELIDPLMTSYANSGWNTPTNDSACLYGGYKATASAVPQTNSITFLIALDPGNWSMEAMYVRSAAAGILQFTLDGVSIGTIDGYFASTARNNLTTLTGVTVAQRGVHQLVVSTPTKNASSTGYAGFLQRIKFGRIK